MDHLRHLHRCEEFFEGFFLNFIANFIRGSSRFLQNVYSSRFPQIGEQDKRKRLSTYNFTSGWTQKRMFPKLVLQCEKAKIKNFWMASHFHSLPLALQLMLVLAYLFHVSSPRHVDISFFFEHVTPECPRNYMHVIKYSHDYPCCNLMLKAQDKGRIMYSRKTIISVKNLIIDSTIYFSVVPQNKYVQLGGWNENTSLFVFKLRPKPPKTPTLYSCTRTLNIFFFSAR